MQKKFMTFSCETKEDIIMYLYMHLAQVGMYLGSNDNNLQMKTNENLLFRCRVTRDSLAFVASM